MEIYYFSGTGNSFWVAKSIEKHFSNSTVKSISEFSHNDVIINDDTLLIVCPIYFYGIPNIVIKFLDRIRFNDVKYFSFIFTAEYPNGLAIGMLKDICREKNVIINSCHYLQMPTNYLIKSKMLKIDEIEKVINLAEKKIKKIIDIIKTKKYYIEKDSRIYSIVVNARKSYLKWETIYPEFDSKFLSLETCNQCKLCQTHCPVGNIIIKDKPLWNKRCAACLKCINICPKQAIQYDNKTNGRIRYFNPKIKINEFK